MGQGSRSRRGWGLLAGMSRASSGTSRAGSGMSRVGRLTRATSRGCWCRSQADWMGQGRRSRGGQGLVTGVSRASVGRWRVELLVTDAHCW